MNIHRFRGRMKLLCLLMPIVFLANVVFTPAAFAAKPAGDTSEVIGCAVPPAFPDYSEGFNLEDFTVNNLDVNDDGNLYLDTGQMAIDPNNIVVPFDQEISVTFLYEGAGYTKTDFGWMLASGGKNGTKHEIYQNINDNNGNGVLDDREGPGKTVVDNRVSLGEFTAGTELVFYAKVDNSGKTYYTKMDWNDDTWDGNTGSGDNDCFKGSFTKTYELWKKSPEACRLVGGWMSQPAIDRLKTYFGLEFKEGSYGYLDIEYGKKFPHVMVGVPTGAPNEWILGWEDLWKGGDTDHNDFIIRINRKSGGAASLKSEKAPVVPDDVYYTSVTMEVYDRMPCNSDTEIHYYVSVDGGVRWEEITEWLEVQEIDENKNKKGLVEDWSFGFPEMTYRRGKIDFASKGYSGNQLVWKAEMMSEIETCVPEIFDVKLNGTVARHSLFSRASPVTRANMLYSGSYETPDGSWPADEKWLRGHLVASRIYDPEDPSTTDTAFVWDAGEQLNSKGPDGRTIWYPKIDTNTETGKLVKADNANLRGDGNTKTFVFTSDESIKAQYKDLPDTKVYTTGQIDLPDGTQIVGGTIKIYDENKIETLKEERTNELASISGGSGYFNRDTGEVFMLKFYNAPQNRALIKADFTSYKTQSTMLEFKPGGDNLDVQGFGLDASDCSNSDSGLVCAHDFNGSGAVDENDAAFLVNWVRGWKNKSNGEVKKWLLGAIDHSTPAVLVPPPYTPAWYFGSATTDAEREVWEQFRKKNENRRTVAFVGSRSGMLHAFDAGQYYWGDNEDTDFVENRGYFDTSGASPNYGNGEEFWAYVPSNLIGKFKENITGGDNPGFVDASPTIADVFTNGAWRSIVMFAQGNGGDTITCLDVTDPKSPKFLWEYTDPDLLKSISSPAVAKVARIKVNGDTRWAAFFVSGDWNQDMEINPSIYVIDVGTGENISRIFLNDSTIGDAAKGGIPSGQPAVIDSDDDGFTDRLYIGTDKGYLYKVNIPGNGSVQTCAINEDQRDADQHIYASPVAIVDRQKAEDGTISTSVRVFYGTGDSPYDDTDDMADHYYFYGYVDTDATDECTKMDPAWTYELPKGERVWASAFASAGQLYFGTASLESEDPCAGYTGTSSDTNTGTIYEFAQDLEEGMTLPAGGPLDADIPSVTVPPLVFDEHLFVKTPDGKIWTFGDDNSGWNNEVIQKGITGQFVRAWRELF